MPDARALTEFLTELLDLRVLAVTDVAPDNLGPLLGGAPGWGPVRSTMLGSGTAGLIEVVDAVASSPWDATDTDSHSGPFVAVSFNVDDLVGLVACARRAGHDVGDPIEVTFRGRTVLVAVASIAGVPVQLTQTLTPTSATREN